MKISSFLSVQNTSNLSNLFHGQTQAEYYLVGPKIVLMVLYSIFSETISSSSLPLSLNHNCTEPVIFHTGSVSGLVNKMSHIPTSSSPTGKCLKLQ